ncbi:MAG: hypothetical protein ACI9WS_000927 [Paraglaciecola psychrophila]|jgi:hypothetical protein
MALKENNLVRYLIIVGAVLLCTDVSAQSPVANHCFASLSASHCAATHARVSAVGNRTGVTATGSTSDREPGSQSVIGALGPVTHWLVESMSWLEETQFYLSKTVQNTAVSIDRYIARDSFDELAVNESYLRLRLSGRLGQSGQQSSEARFSGKVDLPNSKRKVKLIFDTDPDDFDSLEQKQRNLGVGTALFDKSSGEAAVGLAVEQALLDNWKLSLGGGVRLRSSLDPYARLRLTRRGQWAEHWSSRIRETFFYYDSKSWGLETELDLYRKLDNDRLLHFSLGGQYLDSDNNWEWVHGISLNRRLDRNNAIEYQVGVSANSNPSAQVSNYWLRGKWQHRLYRNWLYLSVVPEVAFPRDQRFSASYQLTAELEIYFSKDLDLRNRRIRY